MPIIPTIYFFLLTLFFIKKEGRLGIAGVLSIIYLISSICGILIDVFDLYGEYGVSQKEESYIATLLYCIGITLFIYPFSFIRLSSNMNLQLLKPGLFKCVSYIIILCFIASLISQFDDLKLAITMTPEEVKAYHYDQLSFAQDTGRGSLLLTIPNIIASVWSLSMLMWFVSITFMNNNAFINIGLLLCSTKQIISSILIAGRAAVVYWLFCFICYLFLFYPLMKRRSKIIIFTLAGIIVAIMIAGFTAITISRFVDRDDHSVMFSIIAYAGQQYNNFCHLFVNIDYIPITLDRIMPLTAKYILGHGEFHLSNYYDFISGFTGFSVNNFYTLLGGLLLTIGFNGMIVYSMLVCIITTIICHNIHCNFTFYNLILLSILIQVPTVGMFDVPFPYTGDSMCILFTILLYIIFKYKL